MTRTERAAFPRAIIKDRAESKSGMDKSTPKHGAGPHNWGSLIDERELEEGADYDEARETEAAGTRKASPPSIERRTSSVSDEDREKAREFRKNALRADGLDLSAIARTSSAVSTSPPNQTSPIVTDANTAAVKVD
ncbi:hypothetical protein EIP91_003363 [Steccherinum ochraceum]|uniref:Hyaluronan/mRNA-binding protein domain-containing protein n=1 Tax=Steccherinum ochraceum TaxID=92696 RepID=A0A4R0RD73_9APHY|nr:hypothetical protein EIP91_003363 [Steccherinum ochraceum]